MEMEFIKPIIEKIGANLLERIGQQIGYLIHLNSNIRNLKDQFQKLDEKRRGLQLGIDEDKRNGKLIAPEIESWVRKVDNISPGLQRFLEEDVKANTMCLDGWCPNPKSRYSWSRNAKKKTLEIDGLLRDANAFVTKASYSRPPLGIGSLSIEGIMDLESRTKMRREVLEALRADKDNMIAICGMGGIGKTTMAKELAKRVKDEKLFDEVAMAVVSKNKDLSKIQGQIADMLGLELKKESEAGRAGQLYSRLMDIKSVLVILDDVWDALDLDLVGIPYGGQHNRCKILLTSRSEEACTQMKSQKIFKIEVLSKEEAWSLFREMAGNCVDTTDLRQTAEEVAKECGGLPVAIVTVGKALENKGNEEWIAALHELKNSIPKNIPGMHSKVYSSIEFSYKYLESDEAKSCFLLCSLFPEDDDIPIELLVRYGVGQSLFAKIDTVAEARNRVHAIVKNLKRSFLLLDSEEGEQIVKMHDVVRDVAISIAENQGFLVRFNEKMEEWPEKDSCERSTAISLGYKELKRHRDGLECPKLELLQLAFDNDTSQTLPPNLFKGMKGLKVLALFDMSFPSLPQSINVLQNLRALQFVDCKLTDVSAIGALTQLQILSFLMSEIKELPGEMRNLSYLKLLELTGCSDLERIPPDLLASLSHLEELYMDGVDVNWKPLEEEEKDEEEGANASLTELMSLSYLMALKIQIPNIKVLPKDLAFKNETIKFQIFAGYNEGIDEGDYLKYIFKNSLGLASCGVRDIVESRMLLQLLKKSEILKLEKIKDLKNIGNELNKEGFQCLKVLKVSRSEDVEYVMDATSDQNPCAAFPTLESLKLRGLPNLKEIYHSQFLERSFSGVCFGNLKSMKVSECHRLRYLFPPSVAKLLVELQSIKMEACDAIENIVQSDGEEEATDIILFPRVSSLKLRNLPNMMSFCIKAYSFEWSSIKEINLRGCPKLKTIGSKIQSPRKSKKISRELDSRPNEQELGSPGFHWQCLECIPRRKNYGQMAVSDQDATNKSQRSYSVKEEDALSKPTDPKVSDSNSPSEIWSFFPSHIIECLKNLESILVVDLPSPEVLFQLEELNVEESHMAPILNQLRKLDLGGLPKLMHIWKKGPQRILGFGNLRLLDVWSCNSLTYLFSPSIAKLLVMLEKIEVGHCEKIEEILARAREEEKEKDVLFDKVNSIMLRNLPNLKCFCYENNALEWPSLEIITVEECPSLSTFIPSNLKTPKLEGVYNAPSWKAERTCHWKGDVNATIEHIFKGKEV